MEPLNYDIMQKIGHEVHIVRETAKNKATFNKVVEAVDSIKPFVEINRMKHEYWYRNDDPMHRYPLNPNDDDWFIRNLWECQCEHWWGDDDETSPEVEDWLKACPFNFEYGGTGDYYTVLTRLQDK